MSRNINFLSEEHLENTHFPILIEYTDCGEQFWADSPEDIDDGRAFVVKRTTPREEWDGS
jgi:hypothetical protein